MLLYFSASGIGKGPQRIQRLSLDLTLKLSAHLLEGKPGLGGGGDGWFHFKTGLRLSSGLLKASESFSGGLYLKKEILSI